MRSILFPKATQLKLVDSEYNNHFFWLFLLVTSLSIFLFDLHTPLGVAAGTPYALIVFASLGFKNNRSTYIATVIGISFIVLGFFLSPGIVAPMEVILTNRILGLMIITITAYMVLKIKKVNHELFTLMTKTYIDPLTNCKNNRAFQEEVKTEINRSNRYKRNLSLAIFDIAHCNSANNKEEFTYGLNNHSIKLISYEIRKSIRSSDQLYRVDENRFVVLYAETDINKAKDASDALCEKVSRMNQPDIQHGFTVSVGITMLDDGDNLHRLYKRAEEALSVAKENGVNQVATFPETMNTGKSHIPAILCRPRSG
ncbi:diguanylate cyclase (GGDEF) domain-containing protein [Nitrosomonas aestuarii]|uniref:diguanylate cyclase n=1 Tax=Nitrosomonas aestuarii TaxID=52441 RepID=A0A1I4A5V4_9PROT|nr:diguanylate cyclase (GGDEF) domain-containing protein [Nitrosomonas aestuarii]